ncbi:hypothetical protein COCOBI_17-2620 [Coccomyxa sp. Obi]|nr:hypothetical protein COCOBI_17-2620 [Coccomyxa sp. Obi]
MSNNSSVEQLQSDIAEWFRENQPEGYELAAPPSASKLRCESGAQCGKNMSTPGKSVGRRVKRTVKQSPPRPRSSTSTQDCQQGQHALSASEPAHLTKGYSVERGADGRALWLPDSPASCSERGCPFDEDTAPYCQVMNIWTLQQESAEGGVPGQEAAVQVLQRLPHSMFEAAARKLCKRSAALSIDECREYKRAACLSVMTPKGACAGLAGLQAAAGTCCSLSNLLPTPTSVLDGPTAFPPSPPQEESVDFLVASSPGSQSCVGESGGSKRRSPVCC